MMVKEKRSCVTFKAHWLDNFVPVDSERKDADVPCLGVELAALANTAFLVMSAVCLA